MGQALALVVLVSGRVAGAEVVEPGHHRVGHLLLFVGRQRLLAHQPLERRRLQFPDLVGRQFDAELVADPLAGGLHAEVRLQEPLALAEVDLLDGRPGPLDEEVAHLIAAQLLQVAVAEAQVPAGVDRLGQRLPVPFRLLFLFGQVLFQGFEHLAFGHPLGLVAGVAFGVAEIHAAEVLRIELDRQRLARPAGERLGAVVLVQELVEVVLDLLVDHRPGSTACSRRR